MELDYVLFTALFQATPDVRRLKPRQIKPVGWIKEQSDESTIDPRGSVTSFLNPPYAIGFTWVTTITAAIVCVQYIIGLRKTGD